MEANPMADKSKVVKSETEWKQQLTPEQYQIARKKGTERAFTGEYHNTKEKGVYRCACCGTPLFSSETKYDSGSGWPSFWRTAADGVVEYKQEMDGRIECRCAACKGHLGHVFSDGPEAREEDEAPSTDLRTRNGRRPRYCLNGAALFFRLRGGVTH